MIIQDKIQYSLYLGDPKDAQSVRYPLENVAFSAERGRNYAQHEISTVDNLTNRLQAKRRVEFASRQREQGSRDEIQDKT